MKKILTAIALSIAIPAVANAQAPAPAPKPHGEMKAKCECCKDMAKMDHSKHDMKAGADAHAGHDMAGAKAPQADTHQNQQN